MIRKMLDELINVLVAIKFGVLVGVILAFAKV